MRFPHRHLHRILLVLTVLALGGCELLGFIPDDEPSAREAVEVVNQTEQFDLQVHLNNSFDDDRVRVKIDGREVFDGRVTTNYVLSLAEVIKLTESSGTHEIEVQVNDGEPERTTFDLDHPLYILVRYYSEDLPSYNIEHGIYFDITEERPMYD